MAFILFFYFVIVGAWPFYQILIHDSCGNGNMREIQDRMEANCFVAFSPIPYYLEKSY
jgi:hypothetical protein